LVWRPQFRQVDQRQMHERKSALTLALSS